MDILSIETNRKGKLHYTYLVKTARCIKGKWVTFKADNCLQYLLPFEKVSTKKNFTDSPWEHILSF